jgi:cobalt/nickel transport system permease protein
MNKNAHRGGFIEHSLIGILAFIKSALFAEEHALKNGLMQSLDARIKILTSIIFMLLILFTKNILVILFLYLFCLLLVCVSNINPGFFLKRTWIFIPLFSLFIGLPALFGNFTPGQELFNLKIAGWVLVITRPGVLTFLLFVLRVVSLVSFAVLLSITTRHFELLKALRIFAIPQVFVMVLGICYRYIYLFIGIIENTYLALKSRVGVIMHDKSGRQIVSWNIAFLWQRSIKLNEDVYKAMLSRGYNGEPKVLDDFKAGLGDWFCLLFTGVLGICIIRFFQ